METYIVFFHGKYFYTTNSTKMSDLPWSILIHNFIRLPLTIAYRPCLELIASATDFESVFNSYITSRWTNPRESLFSSHWFSFKHTKRTITCHSLVADEFPSWSLIIILTITRVSWNLQEQVTNHFSRPAIALSIVIHLTICFHEFIHSVMKLTLRVIFTFSL